ncbi:DUF3841 domain-containing protein [Neisseria dentiae]|uniref:DUF3841 domain-containing protein n=1 Tax=Neisseria dentiae TaxID=194197 RepID=UPI0035A11562
MLIKLWTVRPAGDYAILQQQGIYTADEHYVMPERIETYQWMSQRLAEKTPAPAGVRFPLWAWYHAHGCKHPKPDLRKRGYLEKGEKGVRIEFMIPASDALLSNFDGWHAVLNDHFFPWMIKNMNTMKACKTGFLQQSSKKQKKKAG